MNWIYILQSAATAVRYKDIFMKKALSSSMWTTDQTVHIKKKVGDILFFGYSDPLLDIARSLPSFSGIEVPPFDKFAWFYNVNIVKILIIYHIKKKIIYLIDLIQNLNQLKL